MAKTYYTKCGRTFKKSSTAGVTRNEELDDKCIGCQYIEHSSSYRGGKQVPITFCQAGSKKPNRKNDYSTTCETDATTLSIISLDMDFLKAIYDFAASKPGFMRSAEWPKVFHGLDREDCRKSMPLYFENNKKGKSLKKSIIDKFFKELQQEKLDSCNKCFECKGFLPDGESSEYGKCTERKSFVAGEQKACDKYKAVELAVINADNSGSDLEGNCHPELSVQSCIDCEHCERSNAAFFHPMPFMCYKADHRDGMEWHFRPDSKACSNFKRAAVSPVTAEHCLYFGGTQDEGKDHLVLCGDDSLNLLNKYETEAMAYKCKSLYKLCRTYVIRELQRYDIDLGAYPPSQKTEHLISLLNKVISESESCPNCAYLGQYHYSGYINSEDGLLTWACRLNMAQANSNSVCCNYKRAMLPDAPDDVKKEDIEVYFDSSKCDRDCKNKRDGKCTIEDVKGFALEHIVKDAAAPDCKVMDKLKVRYLKEERHCSHAHTGCNAVHLACALNGKYCCYTCPEPCNSFCGFAKELVPFGQLKEEDKGSSRSNSIEPAYVFTMDIKTAGQESALNSHLQHIRNKCKDIVGNYVEIGFTLINIKDNKLFKARGYDNLIDCVEAELNMGKSTAYNLIKIADKFGDPETKALKPEYSKFNYVQCLEMSTMTKAELSQVNPDMSKREMQQLKNSNRLDKQPEDNSMSAEKELTPIIDTSESKVIDISDYRIVDEGKNPQAQQEVSFSEAAAALEDYEPAAEPSLYSNESEDFADQESDELKHELGVGNDKDNTMQSDDSSNADSMVNELLNENFNLKDRIRELENDRAAFRELVSKIDSDFEKLTKKQIRNALWDFIGTGEIIFMND
jgi:hypothetical protein